MIDNPPPSHSEPAARLQASDARRTRFLKMQAMLREQHKRMQAQTSAEFEQVVESIAYRLRADEQAGLIAYHAREVWERCALSLPENWQDDMTAYVRRDVARHPWFRASPTNDATMTSDQIHELARFLVSSHRQAKRRQREEASRG